MITNAILLLVAIGALVWCAVTLAKLLIAVRNSHLYDDDERQRKPARLWQPDPDAEGD